MHTVVKMVLHIIRAPVTQKIDSWISYRKIEKIIEKKTPLKPDYVVKDNSPALLSISSCTYGCG